MSTLPESVGTALAVACNLADTVSDLEQQARDLRRQAVEPLLNAIAESGLVSHIVIRGYTPAFNDGEPCEHSYDYAVNIADIVTEEMIESLGEMGEDIGENWSNEREYNQETRSYVDLPDAIEANKALCAKHGAIYETPPADLMRAISALLVEDVNAELGTNYIAIYTFKDGKWSDTADEYYCGW